MQFEAMSLTKNLFEIVHVDKRRDALRDERERREKPAGNEIPPNQLGWPSSSISCVRIYMLTWHASSRIAIEKPFIFILVL